MKPEPLGFSIKLHDYWPHTIPVLRFRFLTDDEREHVLEIRTSADPDMTAIQLHQLADAIEHVMRTSRTAKCLRQQDDQQRAAHEKAPQ